MSSAEDRNSPAVPQDETSRLVSRLQRQIGLVLDSITGKRTPRNLWGLNPIRSQTLTVGGTGELILPYCKVAGIKLDSETTTIKSVDNVMMLAMAPYHPLRQTFPSRICNYEHYRRYENTTKFKTGVGIEFTRIELKEAIHMEMQEMLGELPSFGRYANSLTWSVHAVSNDRKRVKVLRLAHGNY